MNPMSFLLVLSQPDFVKQQLCPVVTGRSCWWTADSPACRR